MEDDPITPMDVGIVVGATIGVSSAATALLYVVCGGEEPQAPDEFPAPAQPPPVGLEVSSVTELPTANGLSLNGLSDDAIVESNRVDLFGEVDLTMRRWFRGRRLLLSYPPTSSCAL